MFGTPLAGAIFGLEVMAMGCVVAYLVSGYTSIYRSQRVACLKHRIVPKGITLAELPGWQREQAQTRMPRDEAKTDS